MKLRYFIIGIIAMLLGCVWIRLMIALLIIIAKLDIATKTLCIVILMCIASLIFSFEKR